MLIQAIDFNLITFTYCEYPPYLKSSLLRIGLNFPIILQSSNDYTCVDGHKRLSAIYDILQNDPDHKLKQVTCRFLHARSQNPKSLQNHH